jgi:hypothetical protein
MKVYTIGVTYVNYSSAEVVVEAELEELAIERAQELWGAGEIETAPVDGDLILEVIGGTE